METVFTASNSKIKDSFKLKRVEISELALCLHLFLNTTKQTRVLPNRSAMTRRTNAAVMPISAASEDL